MKYLYQFQLKKITISWWVLLVFWLLLFPIDLFNPANVRGKMESIISPYLSSYGFSLDFWLNPLLSPAAHRSEQLALISLAKQQLAQDLADAVELKRLQTENQVLRESIDARHNNSKQLEILARPIASYAVPMVDVGSESGVREGMWVSSIEGVLLGRISQVSASVSQIILLISNKSEPLIAQSESSAQGLIKGDGKQLFWLEVPRDIEVRVGERLLSLGQPGLPADQLIGIVASVQTAPTAPAHTILVDQLVNFYQLPMVIIHE